MDHICYLVIPHPDLQEGEMGKKLSTYVYIYKPDNSGDIQILIDVLSDVYQVYVAAHAGCKIMQYVS